MSESIPFSRVPISPVVYLSEAWARVKDRYWLFVGITAVGFILGSLAPLALLLGPMMCGIFLCYRQQARAMPVTFDMLFKGFDHFGESFIASLLMLAAGLLMVFPAILMAVVGAITIGVSAGSHNGAALAAPSLAFGMFGVIALFVMLASLLVGACFLFTYPLILDRGLTGIEAVKLSFRAARANLGGLILLLLLNGVISLAGALCCYIGAFLVLPITFGTHWICYERIFGIKVVDTPAA